MNPGYAGRTELPESIKALFRPVTCIAPDLELICLISLFSDGFLTAKVLAKKMTVLYKLAREQLSKQSHYDWGLRSLNAVLRMAGAAKRQTPDAAENVVLMRVLRDMNFPKFVFDDVPLFLGLLKDLFPGIECPRIGYPELAENVEKVLRNDNYILLSDQVSVCSRSGCQFTVAWEKKERRGKVTAELCPTVMRVRASRPSYDKH